MKKDSSHGHAVLIDEDSSLCPKLLDFRPRPAALDARTIDGETAMQIQRLHHFAWRCRDAEETRAFYEDLLHLKFAHLQADHVPSTGEYCPYVHIFFEMGDGSYIAFFDLGDGNIADPSVNTPAWVNHLALEVESESALMAARHRLEEAGVEVIGVTDHAIIKSIYFFDPNGIRLELTTRIADQAELDRGIPDARADLARWSVEKAGRFHG
jgi:catechol 2,3-dioxygenase-like lactoylglutathione lyase family enzyme